MQLDAYLRDGPDEHTHASRGQNYHFTEVSVRADTNKRPRGPLGQAKGDGSKDGVISGWSGTLASCRCSGSGSGSGGAGPAQHVTTTLVTKVKSSHLQFAIGNAPVVNTSAYFHAMLRVLTLRHGVTALRVARMKLAQTHSCSTQRRRGRVGLFVNICNKYTVFHVALLRNVRAPACSAYQVIT
jgi:hypothetical protein